MDGQQILPGAPVRIIVSAVWESPERACTVRMTIDGPSDDFSSQMIGTDLEGKMTMSELESALTTLCMGAIDRLRDTWPQGHMPDLTVTLATD